MVEIISKTALILALLIAGCDRSTEVVDHAKATGVAGLAKDPEPALSTKIDPLRDRVWVLRPEHLTVYDRRTNRLIRRIVLPAWSVAEFVCEPDIAIDRSGSAYIAHNIEAKVWRVDAVSFELTEHTVRLLGRETLDIGFSRLTFAPDGTLYGVASAGGTVWRLELASGTGQHVRTDVPADNRCGF